MRTAMLTVLACLCAAPAYAQYNVACDPTCHEVTGPANPTPASRSTSASTSSAKAASTSRSQATGSIAGTQVNAPITSRSAGGSASVTVINQTSASNRSGSGSRGYGSGGGWHRNATSTASTASDPPADPGPALGSPQLPLTENLNTNGTQTIRTPPEIVAPNISGGNPCLVGISGGGSGPGIGITLGIGYSDKGCERRNDAAVLNNLGEKAAAIEVLCEDDNVRAALARAGRPCEADRPRPVATAPAPAQLARTVDPAIIRRQQEIPLQEVATTPKRQTFPDYCYTASADELRRHPECSPH